jgi:hypothetical protein
MGIRKSALAMLGVLALGASACSTEGSGQGSTDNTATNAPVSDQATNAAPSAAQSYSGSAELTRLSNAQYDSAVRELLGVTEVNATFPTDLAAGDHFEDYFNAADVLGEQVFANPLLVSRLVTCNPGADAACTRQIVASFGARAWRGPMSTDDVDRLTKVATDAVALGETPNDSIKQVVKTVLASPQFLYTIAPTAL